MTKSTDTLARITRGQNAVERWLGIVSAAIIMLMMFLTSTDVLMRYVFNSPLVGGFELQEFLLVGVVFLSLAYVQSLRAHFNVDLITSRLSPRAQAVLLIVGHIICIFVFAIITWQSGFRAWVAWSTGQTREGLISFPLWPAKSMIPIGTGLLCLRFIWDILADSHRLRSMSGGRHG